MTALRSDQAARAQAAAEALRAGRAEEARRALEALDREAPDRAPVLGLLGQARQALGDAAGAARDLSRAAELAPGDAGLLTALGHAQRLAGAAEAAEAAWRGALAADRAFVPAAQALARHLLEAGRPQEALAAAERPGPVGDPVLSALRGQALTELGRRHEALAAYRAARDAAPSSALAWHNLASAEGELEHHAAAEAAALQALKLGLDAPETWLVRARALQGLDRLDAAEIAFQEALKRRADFPQAHRDLAQLVWMRTGDAARALEGIDFMLARDPANAGMIGERGRFLRFIGRGEEADALLARAAARPDADEGLLGLAAQAAAAVDPDRAASYAERALNLRPQAPEVRRTLAEARLAQGRPGEALELLRPLRARDPFDQEAIALEVTAWRLLGDARAAPLGDYDRWVRGRRIDAPRGWADLPAYLADLAAALERLHTTTAHPIGQSLRGGSQTHVNLLESQEPAIRAFPAAIDGAIHAYLGELGRGDDPLRSRNTGRYRFAGLWSVRLREAGFHVDHIHQHGWISSACHIVVPPTIGEGDRAGWLQFGRPGVPTRPALPAEHFVRPEPGRLVLFPSFMWHGTAPFSGEAARLTVAFDLLPA